MNKELEKYYSCKKFIQDSDPDKDWCSGENCYKMAGFPEYEPKISENP